MKIYAMQNYNLIKQNLLNFTSKVKNVNYGKINDEYKDKVDRFDDGERSEAEYLGHGLFAKVYRFIDTNFVIKQYNKCMPLSDCRQKAKMLEKVGELSGSQQLMAQVTTENGNEYLISTLVKGEEPDPDANPFNKVALKSFMNTLAELDKKGVYHNDLNTGNCKVDSQTGQIGLLDYQFAMDMDPSNKYSNLQNLLFPECTLPANIQMFEMANLPSYIKHLGAYRAKDFFKDYLSIKSDYHTRRYHYYRNENISGVTPENIEYEMLMSRALKRPSDKLIDLYAKKSQVMYSFRNAFGLTDENTRDIKRPNLPAAGAAYLYAAYQAYEYLTKANNIISTETDTNLVKLMKTEKKVAQYWLDKLSNSALGTSQWHTRNAQGESALLGAKDKYPESMDYYMYAPIDKIDDMYTTITNNDNSGKIDVLTFPYSTGLNSDYKELFTLKDSLKLNDFPASDRDLFARFNSCFKDYEAALNNAKVIALPMLHAFTL